MAMDQRGRVVQNAPTSGWEITGQQQTTGLDDNGRPAEGIKVMFTVAGQGPFSVFVPLSRYNPDNARAAVATLAGHIAQTQGARG